MSPNPERPSTSVLLIDWSQTQRTYWAGQLQSCSPDYQIIEAADGQSGLDIYRSRRIDCVVFEIDLPDRSGLEVLMTLIPRASKPRIAVIVLTQLSHPGVWRLRKTGRMRPWLKDSRRARIWTKPFSVRWPSWDRCPRMIGTGPSSLPPHASAPPTLPAAGPSVGRRPNTSFAVVQRLLRYS
jgi:CheY-like chemotaxis protein